MDGTPVCIAPGCFQWPIYLEAGVPGTHGKWCARHRSEDHILCRAAFKKSMKHMTNINLRKPELLSCSEQKQLNSSGFLKLILVICFILFLKAALHKIWSSDLCLAHHFPWVPGTPASRYIGQPVFR